MGVYSKAFKMCRDTKNYPDDNLEVLSFLRYPFLDFLNIEKEEFVCLESNLVIDISLKRATING